MRISTMLRLGAALLCCILISQAQSQDCTCSTLSGASCNSDGQPCSCSINLGPDVKKLNCDKLIPKCLLMKRESLPGKGGRRPRPAGALVDNDGLYNPDCADDGTFLARQCNGTKTCWCVNSAGVRRTDKGDNATWTCAELVRTNWIIVEMKHNKSDSVPAEQVEKVLRNLITTRYKLPADHIDKIEFDGAYLFIDLKQSSKDRALKPTDVDIADVGYYMEKDIKGDYLMADKTRFEISVDGKNIVFQEPIIMYVDEKPHEMSMKRLTAGVIAVIVVVVVAIVAGIVVLVVTRRKRGRYEKAEMKEMNEMQKELNS